MADSYPPLQLTRSSPTAVFPTLTPAQIERLVTQGPIRQVHSGEVLVDAGEKDAPVFVIRTGRAKLPSRANPEML